MSISFKKSTKDSTGQASPSRSSMDLPCTFSLLLSSAYLEHSKRICRTVRSVLQTSQYGTCLSSPLFKRKLCVKWVCPMRSLVKLTLTLLSEIMCGHFLIDGLICLSFWFVAIVDHLSCHLFKQYLWMLSLKSL